jgi:16S rRNA U1498 N3-methylase RsmE
MSPERPRLFYAGPGGIEGDRALIEGEEASHLARVLRMRPGDRVRIATGVVLGNQ